MEYVTAELPNEQARRFAKLFLRIIGSECQAQPATELTSTVKCMKLDGRLQMRLCHNLEYRVTQDAEQVNKPFTATVPTYLYALGLMSYIQRDIGPDKHVALKKHNNQWTVTATNMTAQEVTKANALLKENLA